ncbi:MAG TPA: hypothetical protein VI248_24815, partial [Kineosporiaceae bacterium]
GAALLAAAAAAGIGVARLAFTWVAAMHGGPSAESWVYQPGWTIVQVACALLAAGAATVSMTSPHGSRTLPALAGIASAGVLGWSLNDGAYQIIASLFYLNA